MDTKDCRFHIYSAVLLQTATITGTKYNTEWIFQDQKEFREVAIRNFSWVWLLGISSINTYLKSKSCLQITPDDCNTVTVLVLRYTVIWMHFFKCQFLEPKKDLTKSLLRQANSFYLHEQHLCILNNEVTQNSYTWRVTLNKSLTSPRLPPLFCETFC